jgi:hypothetical protein
MASLALGAHIVKHQPVIEWPVEASHREERHEKDDCPAGCGRVLRFRDRKRYRLCRLASAACTADRRSLVLYGRQQEGLRQDPAGVVQGQLQGRRSPDCRACRDSRPWLQLRSLQHAKNRQPRHAVQMGHSDGAPAPMFTPPQRPSPQSQPTSAKFPSRLSAAPAPSPIRRRTPPSYPAAPARPRGACRYRR